MRSHLLGAFILTAALVGIAFASRIKTDYDHSIDFGQYKTYSWLKVQAANSLWEDRIVGNVDKELSAKAWTKVEAGGNASVAAFGSTDKQRTLETFYSGFGGGWRSRGFGDGVVTTTVHSEDVGTLVVDVFDAQTKRLVWRGSSMATLSGKAEKNGKKLDKDVNCGFRGM